MLIASLRIMPDKNLTNSSKWIMDGNVLVVLSECTIKAGMQHAKIVKKCEFSI